MMNVIFLTIYTKNLWAEAKLKTLITTMIQNQYNNSILMKKMFINIMVKQLKIMFVVLIHSMLPKDNNLKNLRYFNMINNSILHQIYMLPYQD